MLGIEDKPDNHRDMRIAIAMYIKVGFFLVHAVKEKRPDDLLGAQILIKINIRSSVAEPEP